MSISRGPEQPDAGPGRAAGARHRARERALGLLYEAETKSMSPTAVIAGLPAAAEPYAVEVAEGVGRCMAEIDRLIAAAASGWRVERMPAVDRQLLRLAVFELMERREVPVAVVLDEAVELAKTYSTEGSGRFVNGVLASIALRLRPPEGRPA